MDCIYQGSCGGCSLRRFAYNEQIAKKKASVCATLAAVSQDITFIPAKDIDFYRHKMEFTFGVWDEQLVLGMHEKGKFYKVIDIDTCYMQSEESNRILALCRAWAHTYGITAYHKKRRTGLLRYLIIRQTKHIPGVMVHLIATGPLPFEPLIEQFRREIPAFKSMYVSTYQGVSDVAQADETQLVYGEPIIEERVGQYHYAIGPFNFFQSHTTQIDVLYDTVKRLTGTGKTLFDIYCGVGGFGIYLSSYFTNVYGIELHEESIKRARYNAERNNVTNAVFMTGDAESVLRTIPGKGSDATVVLDPPRSGIGYKMLHYIAEWRPQKIVYVSCNPVSLEKDLMCLKKDYVLSSLVALDMFPHTPHVECVACLDSYQ